MNQLSPEDISADFLYSKLTNEDVAASLNAKIHVVYDLIDLEKSDYNFKQSFCNDEANLYFECMYLFSQKTINEIIDSDYKKKYHFNSSKIQGCLRGALVKIGFPLGKVDEEPLIYHFALDSECDKYANRSMGIRNSRLYFVVGNRGAIHPLFFDPFHELNPDPPLFHLQKTGTGTGTITNDGVRKEKMKEEKEKKRKRYERRCKRAQKRH